jgi:hypothetical protein
MKSAAPRCPDHGRKMKLVDESMLVRRGCRRRGRLIKTILHRRWWKCPVPKCYKVRTAAGFSEDPHDMNRDRWLGAPFTDAALERMFR